MMISKIRYMDPVVYSKFCSWLRSQGTTIGALIKQSGITQDRKVTEFVLSQREEDRSDES